MKKTSVFILLYVMVIGSLSQGIGAVDNGDVFFQDELSALLDVMIPIEQALYSHKNNPLSGLYSSYKDSLNNRKRSLLDNSSGERVHLFPLLPHDNQEQYQVFNERLRFLNNLMGKVKEDIEHAQGFNQYNSGENEQKIRDSLQKLEGFKNRLISQYALILKARKHALGVLSEEEKKKLKDSFVFIPAFTSEEAVNYLLQEQERLEGQGQRATLAEKQRNWSLVTIGVLGALLLESLREKSFVRGGAQALWRKAKSFFRKKPS